MQRSATAVGFNAGLDLATYLTPTVGVGVLVRFSRAMVDLARPDGGGALAVEAGGLHVGGGLRPAILSPGLGGLVTMAPRARAVGLGRRDVEAGIIGRGPAGERARRTAIPVVLVWLGDAKPSRAVVIDPRFSRPMGPMALH